MTASHPFWGQLAQARREGVPAAFKAPLGELVATEETLFAAFKAAARSTSARESGPLIRLYANRRFVATEPDLLPDGRDASMQAYVQRLDRTLGETGLVVNDLQAATPAAWAAAVRVCAGIQRALGVAPGGFSFDLFTGAYRSGFFGVHKDDQEVVTFVVQGRKRFLLWPYEVLADQRGVPHDAQDKAVLLTDLDYAPLRARAIVIEGGPGDVFYWPASYWHVAESDGGRCTTVGLGLFARNSPTRLLDEAVQELIDEGALPRPEPLPAPQGDATGLLRAALQEIGSTLEAPALTRRLEEKLLAFATSFGFRRVLPPDADAALPERVRLLDPSLIAWTVQGDELLWSVAGAVYRYPAADGLVRTLERLAGGETLDVDWLSGELAEEIEPAALRHMLGLLARHHALDSAGAEDPEGDVELAPKLAQEAGVLGAL